MHNSHNEMNNMLMKDSSQDRDEMNIRYNNTNMDMRYELIMIVNQIKNICIIFIILFEYSKISYKTR
jgi:hypothetical protein